jgi:hypothetical protein
MLHLLVACGPTATEVEQPILPEEAPAIAGCVVTVDAADASSAWTTETLHDSLGREASKVTEGERADGDRWVEDEATAWSGACPATFEYGRIETPGDAPTSRVERHERWETTCDAHGQPVRTEGLTQSDIQVDEPDEPSGEVMTDGDRAWVETFANTYADGLLVEQIAELRDGSSRRTTFARDDAGEPVESRIYTPADAGEPDESWTWAREDGRVVSETYTADGVSRVTTYSYADPARPYPSAHAVDEGADGTIDAYASYTYACP